MERLTRHWISDTRIFPANFRLNPQIQSDPIDFFPLSDFIISNVTSVIISFNLKPSFCQVCYFATCSTVP